MRSSFWWTISTGILSDFQEHSSQTIGSQQIPGVSRLGESVAAEQQHVARLEFKLVVTELRVLHRAYQVAIGYQLEWRAAALPECQRKNIPPVQ